jgi:hypothetical protein
MNNHHSEPSPCWIGRSVTFGQIRVTGSDRVQNVMDDLIDERPTAEPAITVRGHQAGQPQRRQCLGDSVISHPDRRGQLADRDTGRLVERQQDFQAVDVSEQREPDRPTVKDGVSDQGLIALPVVAAGRAGVLWVTPECFGLGTHWASMTGQELVGASASQVIATNPDTSPRPE